MVRQFLLELLPLHPPGFRDLRVLVDNWHDTRKYITIATIEHLVKWSNSFHASAQKVLYNATWLQFVTNVSL